MLSSICKQSRSRHTRVVRAKVVAVGDRPVNFVVIPLQQDLETIPVETHYIRRAAR